MAGRILKVSRAIADTDDGFDPGDVLSSDEMAV